MKVYETIEFFCSEGCLEEISTKVFLDEEKAKAHFTEISDRIEKTVYEEFDVVSTTDDSEGDAVLWRNDTQCDAWQSFSAMSWEWCIKLKVHEFEGE